MADTSKWQPIETAPKDGTDVIVGFDIASAWIVRSAHFVYANEWVSDPGGEVDGWWSYENSVTQEQLVGIYEPTHWLPMPDSPE